MSSASMLTSLPTGYHLTTGHSLAMTKSDSAGGPFIQSSKLLLALASTVVYGFKPRWDP
jgi:hypothetical protein